MSSANNHKKLAKFPGSHLEAAGRRLELRGILLVAPYNMQVRKLQQAMPEARVGSVDKFQGQEAAVVIVSMCASAGESGSRTADALLGNQTTVASPATSPGARGLDFLLDKTGSMLLSPAPRRWRLWWGIRESRAAGPATLLKWKS